MRLGQEVELAMDMSKMHAFDPRTQLALLAKMVVEPYRPVVIVPISRIPGIGKRFGRSH